MITLPAILLLLASPPPDQLLPVDEAFKDPSLVAFRQRLLEAARSKDKAFVMSILDPSILVDFGGGSGPDDFARHWELDRQEPSRLWEELATILSLGGKLDHHDGKPQFCAPYTFTHFPSGWDAFESAVILGNGVNVRSRPEAGSPVIETLSYEVVRYEYDPELERAGWVKIVTPGRKPGYVAKRLIRSPIDYRACFVKQADGKWVMRLMVSGD